MQALKHTKQSVRDDQIESHAVVANKNHDWSARPAGADLFNHRRIPACGLYLMAICDRLTKTCSSNAASARALGKRLSCPLDVSDCVSHVTASSDRSEDCLEVDIGKVQLHTASCVRLANLIHALWNLSHARAVCS